MIGVHHVCQHQHRVSEPENEEVVDLALTLENMKEDHHLQVGLLGRDGGNSLEENRQMLVHDIKPFF